MATRILVPLDGYPLSEAVVPLVHALARDTGAVVRLLRVVGPDPEPAAVGTVDGITDAGPYLARIAATLRGRGLSRVFWCIWYGDPGRTIVRVAAQGRADMVVLAAHGRRRRGGLPLGSVAEQVVREATAPVVLLVAGDRWEPPWTAARLVVPLDGSEAATAVLPAVTRLAAALSVTTTLLRVVPPAPGDAGEALRVEAEAGLATAAKEVETPGPGVRCLVRTGSPADVILDQAGPDGLVVMASRTSAGPDAPPFGSVAARVLGHATSPVLFWRGGTRAARGRGELVRRPPEGPAAPDA